MIAAIFAALLAIVGPIPPNAPPVPDPMPERVTWVESALPDDWPIYDAVGIIDQWATSSDWRVGPCRADGWRCYKIQGKAEIDCGGVVSMACSWQQNKMDPLTQVDTAKAARFKEYDRATKLWLLVHEGGHVAGLHGVHVDECWRAMHPHRRCDGATPGLGFSAEDKEKMARW